MNQQRISPGNSERLCTIGIRVTGKRHVKDCGGTAMNVCGLKPASHHPVMNNPAGPGNSASSFFRKPQRIRLIRHGGYLNHQMNLVIHSTSA